MKRTKRIFAFLFCLTLLFGSFIYVPQEQAIAAEKKTILIAASDFQADTHELSQQNMLEIFEQIKKDYSHADGFLFCGDYGLSYDANDSTKGIMTLIDTLDKSDIDIDLDNVVLLSGNHDILGTQNLSKMGNNDPDHGQYGVFAIPEDHFMWFSGYDDHDGSPVIDDHIFTVTDTAYALYDYFDQKIEEGFTKPIFVMSHLPLYYSMRTYVYGDSNYAQIIYDALEYGAKQGLNIIFMHGHNHSQGWDNYLGGARVFLDRGDTMPISEINTRFECNFVTLPFVDLNAGYVGYFTTGNNEAVDKTLTMTVYEISDTEVIIKRYSKDGEVDLKARGVNNSKLFYVNGLRVSESSLGLYKVNVETYKSSHVMPLVTEYVAPEKASCTTKGTLGYYYCASNDTYYEDAALTKVTTKEAREVDYAHVYDQGYKTDALKHYAKCKCGAASADGENHEFKGLYCKTCNYKLTLEKISANKSTCTKAGNNEYYYCAQNNTYYKDKDALTVTTPKAETLPLLEHEYGSGFLKTEEGHQYICSCSAIGEVLEHNYKNGVCTECGYKKTVTPPPTTSKAPKPTVSESVAPTIMIPPVSVSSIVTTSSVAPTSTVPATSSVAPTSSTAAASATNTLSPASTAAATTALPTEPVIAPSSANQNDNSAMLTGIIIIFAVGVIAATIVLVIKKSGKKTK